VWTVKPLDYETMTIIQIILSVVVTSQGVNTERYGTLFLIRIEVPLENLTYRLQIQNKLR